MKNVDALAIREQDGAVLGVKVVPGASRDKIVAVLGDALKIATSAPPERGKANEAVARILAKALDIAARDVTLAGGPTRPQKEFRIAGLSTAALRGKLREL